MVPSLRIQPPIPSEAPAVHAPDPDEVRERLNWLVRLRWHASGCIVFVVVLTSWLGVVTETIPLLVLVALHAAGNAVFRRFTRRLTVQVPLRALQIQMATQIVFDISILTGLLHFAGGADNPFLLLSVFHMAMAGMMLPRRVALAVGAFATSLYALMIGAEALALVPHHALRAGGAAVGEASRLLWAKPVYMVGYIGVYAVANVILILFVHDLVHRMRMADALRRKHEQVAQAQERLARIGTLVAGVAHTIRNPLHGVLSCIDMLQSRVNRDDPSAAEILELMNEGVNRIENVTSRLLVLARENSTAEAPIELGLVVQDALQFAQVRAATQHVDIHVELQDVPLVFGHPERLTEAVTNLVDNAVDACRPGDEVRIRVLPLGDPPSGVRVEVEDTGPGIADADLPKIFEPFFTTKPVGEGTGLGLAIARRVVEDLHGDIRVSSHLGVGTLFCIELPAARGTGDGA